jgi:hypothetical protein
VKTNKEQSAILINFASHLIPFGPVALPQPLILLVYHGVRRVSTVGAALAAPEFEKINH